MPFSAVLIDLDGTLLDTIPDLANAANAMRQELGMPPLSQETIASYVGKGTENLVHRTLSNNTNGSVPDSASVERGLEIFGRHYHTVNGEQAVLYPGVLEGLRAF
ncbi:MAG TPA: HAD hydrolase-like protein, partial [Candidimonas sp.]|nr:HAD hydrolase-like protein [Candidimonas sp.]